jgi:hypothetical protein
MSSTVPIIPRRFPPTRKLVEFVEKGERVAKSVGLLRKGAGRVRFKDPGLDAAARRQELKTDPKAKELFEEKFGKAELGEGNMRQLTRNQAEGFLKEVKEIEGVDGLYPVNILDKARENEDKMIWNRGWSTALENSGE